MHAVQTARDEGFGFFDWLGGVDEMGRTDTVRIVLLLRRSSGPEPRTRMLATNLPRTDPRLDSVGSVFVGAGWHEREAAELFGVEFVGGARRRLLLDPSYSGTPLRKDEVLAARAAQDWPGVKEPGESDASPSRRRMAPPGVPDPDVWGNRDPELPPATPAEVAASAVGGRVRRQRR